jgi:hypothetical protein
MPSLLDDPEAYAFAAQVAEDERKKLGLQSRNVGAWWAFESACRLCKRNEPHRC